MTWEDVPGWFDFLSAYEEAVQHFHRGTLVEVGCYQGRSLCALGSLARITGRDLRVIGVDTCLGSGPEGMGNDDFHAGAVRAGGGTMAGLLHGNVVKCGLADHVEIIVSTSLKAATLFQDNSLEFVFLDARHDYESVRADILAWLPKVAPGGWLGGDDYCPHWPGVVRAVDEMLPEARPWSHDSWLYKKRR